MSRVSADRTWSMRDTLPFESRAALDSRGAAIGHRTRLVIAGLVLAAASVFAYTLARPAAPSRIPRRSGLAQRGHRHSHCRNGAASALSPYGRRRQLQPPGRGALETTSGRRGMTSLQCERVAFSGGRGICLQARRGCSPPTAPPVGRCVGPAGFAQLDGSPSRTRIAPTAASVPLPCSSRGMSMLYSSATFSTNTTLIDMTTGDALGDLESVRDLPRRPEPTRRGFQLLGRDLRPRHNTFYATLRTAGATYLVVATRPRKLTVLHENVDARRSRRQPPHRVQETRRRRHPPRGALRARSVVDGRAPDRGRVAIDRRSDRVARRCARALRRGSLVAVRDRRRLGLAR